jgi:hypothetical protein
MKMPRNPRRNICDCILCGGRAEIRTSRKITDDTRELYVQCLNPECLFRWRNVVTSYFGKNPPKETENTIYPLQENLPDNVLDKLEKQINEENEFYEGCTTTLIYRRR